jgi:hypothetical protein
LNREKSSSCMSASAKGGQFTQVETKRPGKKPGR